MKKSNFLFTCLILIPQFIFSQALLKGKVISDAVHLEGIHVINMSNKKNTLTEGNGFFSILAKPTDTLMFSGMQVQGKQVILRFSDFSENLFFMRLKQKVNQLEEVYVKNYPNINAFSLGIIPKGTKSYTPAQRKLRTASNTFIASNKDGSAGGSVGIDPLINWISGRTAMLKKEVEVESKEKLIAKLSNLYDDVFYIETLKISPEYIKGFQIFVIDNQRLVAALTAKNKTLTTFLLGELAEKYKLMTFPEKN